MNFQNQAPYQQFENERNIHQQRVYDPYQMPPDWELAEEYAKSMAVGEPTPGNDGRRNICSKRIIDRQQIKLNCTTEQLGHLGAGYAMLFEFIKYCIYILLAVLICSSLFNMVTNIMTNDCYEVTEIKTQYQKEMDKPIDEQYLLKITNEKDVCITSYQTLMSLANKKDHPSLVIIQQILNLLTIFVVMIVLQFSRKQQRWCDEEIDWKNITLADYTVIIKNIENDTRGIDYDNKLIDILCARKLKKNDAGIDFIKSQHIKDITLCFDLDEIDAIKAKINATIVKKKKALATGQEYASLDLELKQHLDELHAKENEYNQGTTDKFCGVALISFETEDIKQAVIDTHKIKPWKRFLYKTGLKKPKNQDNLLIFDYPAAANYIMFAEEAPEPSNVNWENQHVTTNSKIARRTFSVLIQICCLGLSFLAIYYLNKVQFNIAKKSAAHSLTPKILGFVISMVILAINKILAVIIIQLARFEKHSTETKESVSKAETTSLAQFFNTALILFIVSWAVKDNVVGKSGLVQNITVLFITAAVMGPGMQALYMGWWIKKLKLWWLKKKHTQNKLFITQAELNLAMELPEFQLDLAYSYVLKQMFFCAFYVTIIPFGNIVAIIELLLLYWIHRYNLVRRSCVKVVKSSYLSLQMTEHLETFLIIFAASNWIFTEILFKIHSGVDQFFLKDKATGGENTTLLILFILQVLTAVLNQVLPMQKFNKKIWPHFGVETDAETKYDRKLFDTDYKLENPAIQDVFLAQHH